MKNFFKNNFYQLLGYGGVIPFVAFFVGYYFNKDSLVFGNLLLVMQMSYGAIIISFLSGAHWSMAIQEKNILRMILSVVPTIVLMPVMFWGMSHSPAQALLMMIVLLWGVFAMDRGYFYYRRDDKMSMPRGYILYRFNLTMLVTIILFATYWIGK